METTKARGALPRWIHPALAAVALAVSWPLLLPWTYDTHDGHYALYNAAQLSHALTDGQVPVRWLPDLFGGRGIPLFLYYHPLAFYLVALLHLAGPGFIVSMKVLGLAAAALSGWSMLAFLRAHVPPEAAAVGAAAYVAAPIHLVEIHVKGDPPAALAYALAPLLLLATLRAARGAPYGAFALGAASAALVLAHSVTALILLPAAALYAALVLPRPAGRGALRVLAGCALGAAAAAFHWVPALAERGLVLIDSPRGILAFDWREHFVAWWQWISPLWGYHGSFAGTRDDMSFQIGPAHVAAIVLGGIALRRAAAPSPERRFGLWALGTVGAALAMTLAASRPVWEAIGPLRYVQFPWRFLMPVALGSAALAALAAARAGTTTLLAVCAATPPLLTAAFAIATGSRLYAAVALFQALVAAGAWIALRRRAALGAVALFGALALPWSAVPLHARIKAEPAIIPIAEHDLAPERVRLGIRRTTARDDYLPRSVAEDAIPPRDPAQEYLPPDDAIPVEDVVVRRGPVALSAIARTGRGLAFDADAPEGGILALNLHDFPGWEVRATDRATGFRQELVPGTDHEGRIVVSLPPGAYRIEARWTETTPRRLWDAVSGAAWAVLAWAALRSRTRKRP